MFVLVNKQRNGLRDTHAINPSRGGKENFTSSLCWSLNIFFPMNMNPLYLSMLRVRYL